MINNLSEREIIAIGEITHYFNKIGVAVVELTGKISVGDKILIQGPNTDFEQSVESMQMEHKEVSEAKSGESVGLKVKDRVREKDRIYKII